jgi:hypothetical protein
MYFHLILTLRSRFSCFSMILTFRNLSDVKWTQSFCHFIFWKIKDHEKKKVNGEHHEEEKKKHHAGPILDHVVGALPLVRPILSGPQRKRTRTDRLGRRFVSARWGWS